MLPITQIILDAYREGIFPMAERAEDEEFAFYKPHLRGLIPIEGLHIPGKLLKTLRRQVYSVTLDTAFRDIIDGCAARTDKRAETWINRPIRDLFVTLHQAGHAHSLEVRDVDGVLQGGLYGLSIGRVFCGESMVSFASGGSKIALVYLCALLWRCGYTVLDTQFLNPHLLQFGAYEIPQSEYETMIRVEMNRLPVRPLAAVALDRHLLEDFFAQRNVAASNQ